MPSFFLGLNSASKYQANIYIFAMMKFLFKLGVLLVVLRMKCNCLNFFNLLSTLMSFLHSWNELNLKKILPVPVDCCGQGNNNKSDLTNCGVWNQERIRKGYMFCLIGCRLLVLQCNVCKWRSF